MIGRGPEASFRLADGTVSSIHAALVHDGGTWLVEDRGSYNGTYVNGVRVERPQPLRHGDSITCGRAQLLVGLAPDGPPAPLPDPTIAASASRPAGEAIPLPSPGAGAPITIGRAGGNTIVLTDPAVSSRHARVSATPSGLVVDDLGSYNGTYVNDALVRSGPLRAGDRIRVGNTVLTLDAPGRTLVPARSEPVLRASAVALHAADGSQRLAPTSLAVSPGELVAILGPAGAGKSTLLNILAGVAHPTSGQVTVGGQHLSTASSDVAYVPQDDIIHRDLTPREALTFAAGLRLPPDHSRPERRAVVDHLVSILDLAECADRTVHNVSGGQRKRASVAMELVGDPRLLFLDEPAGGLDAAHDRDLMKVLRSLASDGRAVVLTTHNTWHLEMCDRIILIGRGGVLRFDGRPADVVSSFGVESLTDVYDRLDRPDPSQASAPPPPARTPAPPPSADRPRRRVHGAHVRSLTARNLRVLLRDGRSLVTSLLAAPVMAALAVLLFGDEALTSAPGASFDSVQFLLALALVATWLGAFAGLRAIVVEAPAWRREFALGVSAGSYLTAKWLVHGLLVVVQALLIVGVAFSLASTTLSTSTLELMGATVVLAALAGLSAGLAVSAFSRTEARAVTIVLPYVVMQFFFAGVVVPVKEMGALSVVSYVTSARWGVAGLGSAADLNAPPQATPAFVEKYGADFFTTPAAVYIGALAAITLACVALTHLFIRRAAGVRA